MAWFSVIVLILPLLILLAVSCPMIVLWPLYAVIILAVDYYGALGLLISSTISVLWIGVGTLYFIPTWRKRLVVSKLLAYIRISFPHMSRTEKEAIEAGDIWWEAEFFKGKPNWETLFSYQTPTLTSKEQAFIDNQVIQLCKMTHNWQILNDLRDLPPEIWAYLKQEKFFGLLIPENYGGLGFSPLAHSTIIMKLATQSSTCAITAMVPNSLGPAELLLKYGTEEQKKYYLPRLATGQEIPCFGLTSLDAGSDAGAMTDHGVIAYGEFNGEKTLGIKLNWDKRYITLAPVATVLGLAFNLYDPEKLLGEEITLGISVCLVPTHLPGVEIGHRHWPLLLALMNGPTRGKDVFVPVDYLIGGKAMAGQGWRMLMECLSEGRGISLPALSAGGGKLLYGLTGAYTKVRQQFNVPIAKFEGIRSALAEIAGKTFMLQAMRIFTVGPVQEGLSPAIASAIAKCQMTEMARDIVNLSMDVHGGKAIQVGPNNYMFPSYLHTPIGITVEGANILMRCLVIFGQGSVRCHPFLLKELNIISEDNEQTLDKFDAILLPHIKFSLSNLARNILYTLSAGYGVCVKSPKAVNKHVRELTRISAAFALLTDVALLVLGGTLKRKETLSGRLADIIGQLYIASSVLKYYTDAKFPEHHKAYVDWSVQYSLWKAQTAIQEFLRNFPNRIVAKAMKFIIFPLGYRYARPNDHLDNQLVEAMLDQSAMRHELLQDCCINVSPHSPKRWLEQAFNDSITLAPLLKRWAKMDTSHLLPEYTDYDSKVNAAVENKLLTEEEGAQLKNYEKLRRHALTVDEFDMTFKTVLTPPYP